LRRSTEKDGPAQPVSLKFGSLSVGPPAFRRPVHPVKEVMMELRTRLNVLAAIVSFAFLTAVVFGMF